MSHHVILNEILIINALSGVSGLFRIKITWFDLIITGLIKSN